MSERIYSLTDLNEFHKRCCLGCFTNHDNKDIKEMWSVAQLFKNLNVYDVSYSEGDDPPDVEVTLNDTKYYFEHVECKTENKRGNLGKTLKKSDLSVQDALKNTILKKVQKNYESSKDFILYIYFNYGFMNSVSVSDVTELKSYVSNAPFRSIIITDQHQNYFFLKGDEIKQEWLGQ